MKFKESHCHPMRKKTFFDNIVGGHKSIPNTHTTTPLKSLFCILKYVCVKSEVQTKDFGQQTFIAIGVYDCVVHVNSYNVSNI